MQQQDPYLRQRYYGASTLGSSYSSGGMSDNDIIQSVLQPAPDSLIENTPGSSVRYEPVEQSIPKAIPVRTPEEVQSYYAQQQQQAEPVIQKQQPEQVQQQRIPAFNSIQDIARYQPKNGDEYEYRRNILQQYRDRQLSAYENTLRAMGADNESVAKNLKIAEEKHNRSIYAVPEDYSKSEDYKAIKEQFGSAIQKESGLVSRFGQSIKEAQEFLDKGEKEKAYTIMEGVLPKQINTLNTGESDAIQGQEFTRIAGLLENAFSVSPTQLGELIKTRGFQNIFSSDPQKYLDVAKIIHDGNVDVIQKKKDFAISVLGNRYAHPIVGAIGGQEKFYKQEQPRPVSQQPQGEIMFIRDSSGKLVPQRSK